MKYFENLILLHSKHGSILCSTKGHTSLLILLIKIFDIVAMRETGIAIKILMTAISQINIMSSKSRTPFITTI